MDRAMKLSALEQSGWTGQLYTQLCFCYAIDSKTSQASVIDTLKDGLQRLTAAFPWVAGQIVIEEGNHSGFGTIKIAPFENVPQIIVKDLTNDSSIPAMETMIAQRFQFSQLDENMLCPRPTLPLPSSSKEPSPVLILQANFIRSGLLLTVNAAHSAMDLVGQVQVIHLLSRACHNEEFSQDEITAGNMDRSNIIPLLDDAWQPTPQPTPKPSSVPKLDTSAIETLPDLDLVWSYFNFSPTSLQDLKAVTTFSMPPDSSIPYISTDDAICALFWSSVARARLHRPSTAPTNLTFRRIVEMRTQMSIPKAYTGNMAAATFHNGTIHDLASQSLGALASQLRSQLLDTESLIHSVRVMATTRARNKIPMPDPSNPINPSHASQMSRPDSLGVTSWTKSICHDVDFNLKFGVPVAVRRPWFTPIEGLIYLLPKTREGDIVAGICLRREDMEILERDGGEMGVRRFADYIG